MVAKVVKVLDAAPPVTGVLVTVLHQAIIKAHRKGGEASMRTRPPPVGA